MPFAAAEWTIRLLTGYVLTGVLFGIPYVSVGIVRADPVARGTGLGFRLLVLPGVVAFWPLLLYRWLRRGNSS